jgi:hypothetical protein
MPTYRLWKSHQVAYDILGQVEHLKMVLRPPTEANPQWSQAYAGWQAKRFAYKSLHERNRYRASSYAETAEIFYKEYLGE